MSENVAVTLELKQSQIDYLDQMVQKHSLPDRSKVLRCLINFAIDESQNEESIYSKTRCNHC
ncbi:hypothetical protein [Gimesia aquarii]|uniref:Ribbon-helix-helix protein CopG domain-containing protein n=1 Tax=Gimesia aquarii TaxID=2527964 RepID=A0A517W365_9PLAN|nr:hypothetical protein [Gimesia aquarii]QDT99677.1 hypothetical protein V144x_51900 [Gimesia aquarii]